MIKKALVGALLLLCVLSSSADDILLAYQGKQVMLSDEVHTIKTTVDKDQFYQALVAEFYNQSGAPKQTLNYYLPLALISDDPALVKRVTEIATATAQLKKGLEAAKHWVELSPNDIEARQYLTLLYLRDNQFEKSSEQLQFVHKIIESDLKQDTQQKKVLSKGLKFIGALLVIEAHHEKAYSVYQHYIKRQASVDGFDKYRAQQNLVLASLAMKAKKYDVVVSALEGIEKSTTQYFASAAMMKSKALQKLGRLNEAAKLLKVIVKDKKTSDSKRLELTRLLIQVGKKGEATNILNDLIAKHPKNNDLLKALIALNIDQQRWREAKRNNIRLTKSKAYQNDAAYFYGEISEGQGKLNKALSNFRKVKSGAFLKNAHKNTARLSAKLESLDAAQQWLQSEQKKSSKKKDQAYWLKLEADLLSDQRKNSDALQRYNKIITLMPNKMSYRYYRGLLFERTKQIKLAEKDFNSIINQQKNNANALNALGFLLLKHTSRFDEARKYIQKAFKLKPNDPTIMDSLGWVYFRTGEMVIAESYLRKAFKSVKNPQIASHLITVLAKSGQHQEARKLFNEMIKKYPDSTTLGDVKMYLKKL
ncbi:MAG: tetratricopeptide repeat protein [Cocleimonas sp.]|nr:tetratricopeptide repeat protein [Cocleimonas sp.]